MSWFNFLNQARELQSYVGLVKSVILLDILISTESNGPEDILTMKWSFCQVPVAMLLYKTSSAQQDRQQKWGCEMLPILILFGNAVKPGAAGKNFQGKMSLQMKREMPKMEGTTITWCFCCVLTVQVEVKAQSEQNLLSNSWHLLQWND